MGIQLPHLGVTILTAIASLGQFSEKLISVAFCLNFVFSICAKDDYSHLRFALAYQFFLFDACA